MFSKELQSASMLVHIFNEEKYKSIYGSSIERIVAKHKMKALMIAIKTLIRSK